MNIDTCITLNPPQQFVVDSKMLETGFSCVLQMSTGTGKTWLAQLAIRHTLAQGKRVIYLTPLRALADELYPQWVSKFVSAEVGIFTGDYGKTGRKYPVPFANADVLIMTPERLDACTRTWRAHWHWIPKVDLIVVDEAHLVGERNRGGRLEGAIGRFRRLNPFCRFLCLSATLGNREELADWLGGIEYESSWRPVPLTWRISRYRKADEKPSLLVQEVANTKKSGGKVLVFAQSRRRCENLSGYLNDQGIEASYHHAGLTYQRRKGIEEKFRAERIDALIATGTLEMGLNMPVRQVILYDTQFFDGTGFSPLPVNTVWQRAGRAGRPGLDAKGEAVLFSPTWDHSAERYHCGRFEKINSTLSQPSTLAEQIVAEVGSGLCRSVAQLERALGQTLASFQNKRLPIGQVVQQMLDASMLQEVEPNESSKQRTVRLTATPLGRVACRHLIQPATVVLIKELFEKFPNFTHFDILFILSLTPDCEPVIPVDFEELSVLGMQLDGLPSQFCTQLRSIIHWNGSINGKRILSALKTAGLILEWCNQFEGDAELGAEEFSIYPFELIRLKESFLRLLLAATSISKYIFTEPGIQESEEKPVKPEATMRLELLHHMVASGLPAESAAMACIPGVGPKWIQKLNAHGIADLRALAEANSKQINIKGLSHSRAHQWRQAAVELYNNHLPSTEQQAPLIECSFINTDKKHYDPYRMRRAMDLAISKTANPKIYNVTGGLEPHRVSRRFNELQCDCADFAKGNLCKHIIAVGMQQDQSQISKFRDNTVSQDNKIDLFRLWFES